MSGSRLTHRDWLREFPALGHWLSKKIGLTTSLGGLSTPAEHWETIQCQLSSSDPPLPEKVFLFGRENACTALQNLFEGKSKRLLFFAESEKDVEDFVSAYLASLEDEISTSYRNRCLFVSEEDAWRSIVEARESHVLVASPKLGLESQNADLQTLASQKGHAVVIPVCEAWSGETPEIVRLRSPSKSQLEIIFTEARYPLIRAKELASAGAHRLSALRRYLLGLGTLPPYASWENARLLAQAGMIGKWDGNNPADQEVLEVFLGKKYGEWIERVRPEVLRADTPLIQKNEKWRVIPRGEAWDALGPQLTDEDLDRFQRMAMLVLGERDPCFDLSKEERYTANIQGKSLKYSKSLMEGIAESLALLGSRPSALSMCSQGKADSTAVLTIREFLENADWERWAGIHDLLPLLAEAAPNEFLKAVELALENLDESPFNQVFAQEVSGGFGGAIYTSGLLWALEALAWHSDHLTRVVLLLGDLAAIDPGGNWSNRPSNSLADIFLPWHFQTCAPLKKRMSSVKALLREHPDIGWNLLLALLPHSHGVTSGCHKPAWRDCITPDWKETVTQSEYWEQISIYAGMAISLAEKNPIKLRVLIDHIPDLPKIAFDNLLSYLSSTIVTDLPETERMPLWEAVSDLARKHRKYSDADWAMPEETILKIERTVKLLTPQTPTLRFQHLFSGRDYDLYNEKGNFEEQRERLDKQRQKALQELLGSGGLTAVLEFSQNVSAPNIVGRALGNIATDSIEAELLPVLIETDDDVLRSLIGDFIWARFHKLSWLWANNLLIKEWSHRQISMFLTFLPFEGEVWHRAEDLLGDEEGLYWKNVAVNLWGGHRNLTVAIEKLISHGRANAAVQCLGWNSGEKTRFDPEMAVRALYAVLESREIDEEFDRKATVEVIVKLQNSPSVNDDTLLQFEWDFLPLLDRFSNGSPKTLENHLASDPAFYCKVIGLVYRSKKDTNEDQESTEHQRNLAEKAYQLLNEWSTPPGTQVEGSFNPDLFNDWLTKMKKIATETGYLEIAKSQFGEVLTHIPEDDSRLWIHHVVAESLNAKDAKEMRSGFTTALFNQRGIYGCTAGKAELELAQIYRSKAEALEGQGYTRFATSMRELAEGYEREAAHEASRDYFD